MISDSGSAPAKVIKNFRKKSNRPILKGAFIEQTVYIGDDQIDKLVAIKSKNEVIGDIISLLQSPIKNVVSSLQSGGGKLSGILKSLSERNEENVENKDKKLDASNDEVSNEEASAEDASAEES